MHPNSLIEIVLSFADSVRVGPTAAAAVVVVVSVADNDDGISNGSMVDDDGCVCKSGCIRLIAKSKESPSSADVNGNKLRTSSSPPPPSLPSKFLMSTK